jgi:hypothetical protein
VIPIGPFFISKGLAVLGVIGIAVGLVVLGISLANSSDGSMPTAITSAEQPVQEPAPFTQEAQEAYEQRVANAPVAVKPQSKPVDPMVAANAEKIAVMLGQPNSVRIDGLKEWSLTKSISKSANCNAPWRYTADPYRSTTTKAVVVADIPGCSNQRLIGIRYDIFTTYTANGTVVPTNTTFSQTK